MAATERVVVLMSPAEKAALQRKAASAGRLSAGEFVRRAIAAYEEGTEAEKAELEALLPVLRATHEETMRRLELAERKVDVTLAALKSQGAP